jgi:hypothetical protein
MRGDGLLSFSQGDVTGKLYQKRGEIERRVIWILNL